MVRVVPLVTLGTQAATANAGRHTSDGRSPDGWHQSGGVAWQSGGQKQNKTSKNPSAAEALFGEQVRTPPRYACLGNEVYLCVLLTCLTKSHAHAFFKATDAQKVVNLSLYSHAL